MTRTRPIALAVLLLTGCGNPPAPPDPSTATTPAVTRLEPLPDTPQTAPATSPTGIVHKSATAALAELETKYLAARDLYNKLLVLNQLPELPAAEALAVLARLFEQEDDAELRAELLYSIHDVDGEVAAKLDLLALAIQPNQPYSVRITAIDLLVELNHEEGIAILQNFLTDPDPEIRQAVNDAIELLRPAAP